MNQKIVENTDEIEQSRKPILITIFLTVLALLSPIAIQLTLYGENPSVLIMSFLYGFGFNDSRVFFSGIPKSFLTIASILLLPRFAPIFQMRRYYSGNSTRRFSLLVALGSESTGLLMILPTILFNFSGGLLIFPLPLIFIFCGLLLFLSHRPTPHVPWGGKNESKGWWEKNDGLESSKDLES